MQVARLAGVTRYPAFTPRTEGSAAPPDQRGWKDMVVLDDDDWSEIVVRFDHPATDRYPYMYHCHILEHEDRGMMGQFTVG